MTVLASIQSALRAAVDVLSETWQYRRMSSPLATATRTWGAWVDVSAIPIPSIAGPTDYDGDRDEHVRTERAGIRVRDDAQALTIGDQVKSPAGTIWSVEARESGGTAAGSVRYLLRREITLKGGPGRAGGP